MSLACSVAYKVGVCSLQKNDFCLVSVRFCKKTAVVNFIFSFIKLTAVFFWLVSTFVCQHHLSFMPLQYDSDLEMMYPTSMLNSS